eukprot:gene3590-4110_t
MELSVAKSLMFFGLLLLGFFGMIPHLVDLVVKISHSKKERAISYGNCFVAGVFLSIGFVHLLAEAAEKLSELVDSRIPVAFVVAPIGFLFVFIIEKVAVGQGGHGHSHGPSSNTTYQQVLPHDDYERVIGNGMPLSSAKSDHAYGYGTFGDGQSLLVKPDHPTTPAGPTPLILVFILSIHSIISGFTLGMEEDYNLLIPLFIGIASHKWLEAMSLGVSLLRGCAGLRKTLKYVFLYSLTEPLGMLGGVAYALSTSEVNQVGQSVVLAFSAGTFIYIALMDILVVEFDAAIQQSRLTKLIKLFFCIIGFVGMSALVLAFHEHDHSESGSHDSHDH